MRKNKDIFSTDKRGYSNLRKSVMEIVDNEDPAVRDYMNRMNVTKPSFHESVYKILSIIFDNNNCVTYGDISIFLSNLRDSKLNYYINFLIYTDNVKRLDLKKEHYQEFYTLQFNRKDNYLYKPGIVKMKKKEIRTYIIRKNGLDPDDPILNTLVNERFDQFIDKIFNLDEKTLFTLTEKGQKLLFNYINIYLCFGVSLEDLGIALDEQDLKKRFNELGLPHKFYESL